MTTATQTTTTIKTHLMKHEGSPNRIIAVKYEETVKNGKTTIKVIAATGLFKTEWEAGYDGNFNNNERDRRFVKNNWERMMLAEWEEKQVRIQKEKRELFPVGFWDKK